MNWGDSFLRKSRFFIGTGKPSTCPKGLFIWQAVKPVRTKPLSMATESWGFNFILKPPKRLLKPSFTDVLMN